MHGIVFFPGGACSGRGAKWLKSQNITKQAILYKNFKDGGGEGGRETSVLISLPQKH